MKTTVRVVALLVAVFGAGLARGAAEPSPDLAAVTANDRAFEAAYARADVKAVAQFFADDADYTSEDGRAVSGRAAIEEVLRTGFLGNKGAVLSIRTDTVRALAPDILVAKGSTRVASRGGEPAGALFTAVYVKKDGQLKISQLVESPLPDVEPGDRLMELAWLLGDWQEADESAGVTIHSRFAWARGGAYMTRTVTVKRGDDPVLEGWQIIGWDPVAKGIRSWTFDGAGGFSEGAWTREGQRWLIREKGYAGDGGCTTAEQTITKAGDDRFYWESGNRTLDGDPLPGIGRIQILRVKGS